MFNPHRRAAGFGDSALHPPEGFVRKPARTSRGAVPNPGFGQRTPADLSVSSM
jgi:hypothetical protein